MKRIKRVVSLALAATITVSMAFNFGGCSKELSPLSPEQSKIEQDSKLDKFTTLSAVIDVQDFEIIKRTTEEINFLQPMTFQMFKSFTVSQLISATNGGTITVGDEVTGYSSITFDPGDLNQDLTVDFNWDSQTFTAEFGPHGTTFADSVLIRLSYKDADLSGIDENDLRIWFYDEDDQLWEMTGRIVNTTEKYVEGKTTHFSRYAVGGE